MIVHFLYLFDFFSVPFVINFAWEKEITDQCFVLFQNASEEAYVFFFERQTRPRPCLDLCHTTAASVVWRMQSFQCSTSVWDSQNWYLVGNHSVERESPCLQSCSTIQWLEAVSEYICLHMLYVFYGNTDCGKHLIFSVCVSSSHFKCLLWWSVSNSLGYVIFSDFGPLQLKKASKMRNWRLYLLE